MSFAKYTADSGTLRAPGTRLSVNRGDDDPSRELLRAEVAFRSTAHRGTPEHFLGWMASLSHIGPGQQHALFGWLALDASIAQLLWFLKQESTAEAGFAAALAAVSPSLPTMASQGWMRSSRSISASGMIHTRLRQRVLRELDQMPAGAPIEPSCVAQSSALADLMRGLSRNPRYAYHAVGAIAAVELGVLHRMRHVARGLHRFGLPPLTRSDHRALKAGEPILESDTWLHAVVTPLVNADPTCMQAIAEGALMCMLSAERCFDRYATALQPEQFDLPARSGAPGVTAGIAA